MTKLDNTYSSSFLEKVNENALAVLLRKGDVFVETQRSITVHFEITLKPLI